MANANGIVLLSSLMAILNHNGNPNLLVLNVRSSSATSPNLLASSIFQKVINK